MALEVTVSAVAQAGSIDVAEPEQGPEVVAWDEVPAEVLVEDALQLAVLGIDAGIEDGDHDVVIAPRRRPGSGDAHPVVVPLEDALGVGDSEEGGEVVPRVGEGRAELPVTVGRPAAAARVLVATAVVHEQRVLEGGGDRAAAADALRESVRARHSRERADLAQVGHDDSAGGGNCRAHLGRRRARHEADHGDSEGVRGSGRPRERECAEKRRKEKTGPLHRSNHFGKATELLYSPFRERKGPPCDGPFLVSRMWLSSTSWRPSPRSSGR